MEDAAMMESADSMEAARADPLRVLIVINNLAGGGAERAVLTSATALIDSGTCVTIVTLDDSIAYEVDNRIDYHCLHIFQFPREHRQQLAAGALRALVMQLESAGGEAHGPFQLSVAHLPASSRIAELAQLPNCYHCVHNAASRDQLGEARGLRRLVRRQRMRTEFRNRRVIAVSRGVADDLVQVVGARPLQLEIILNPVDVRTVREAGEAPNPFECESYIVHVGRFDPQKRHDRLLHAFARARITQQLVLLGEGELLDETKALAEELGIAERVTFAGFHQNPFPIIRDARALVLSSDFEGLGMVLIEAMALGVIPVSMDCPSGPSEVLRGPLRRFLVPAGDEEKLTEAIEDAVSIDDPSRTIDFDDLLRPFSAETAAQKYISLASRTSQSDPSPSVDRAY